MSVHTNRHLFKQLTPLREMSHLSRYSINSLLKFGMCILAVSLFSFVTYRRNIKWKAAENLLRTDTTRFQSPTIDSQKYNLLEEMSGISRLHQIITGSSEECTLEYINENKLQQDHPCVIEIIQRDFLKPPASPDTELHLDSDSTDDRSPGQTGVIFRLLKNQTEGFFVDCGALDGEFMSNTIDLERKFGWTGILIEANPITYEKLKKKNRKSWSLPVCLSLEPYPTKVTFQPKTVDPGHSHIEGSVETLQKPGVKGVDPDMVTVQCFPFYSILLAVGRTQIDFFSLDVEGHELAVLKTIPLHKVDIKSLTVEWDNIPNGEPPLTKFMEENGFLKVEKYSFKWSNDVIFIKDMINTPREYN